MAAQIASNNLTIEWKVVRWEIAARQYLTLALQSSRLVLRLLSQT